MVTTEHEAQAQGTSAAKQPIGVNDGNEVQAEVDRGNEDRAEVNSGIEVQDKRDGANEERKGVNSDYKASAVSSPMSPSAKEQRSCGTDPRT